ncbi:MAG: transporter substrate-binding domain-containing protein, partial [Candidatus Riflebacteria bacterium]
MRLKLLLVVLVSFFSVQCYAIELKVDGFVNFPLTFLNDDGEVSGLIPDLLREIAKENGWKLRFDLTGLSSALVKARNNEVDILLGLAKTEEREKFLDFANDNLITMWSQVFLPIDSDIQTAMQ